MNAIVDACTGRHSILNYIALHFTNMCGKCCVNHVSFDPHVMAHIPPLPGMIIL